jgi:hypothetical protein
VHLVLARVRVGADERGSYCPRAEATGPDSGQSRVLPVHERKRAGGSRSTRSAGCWDTRPSTRLKICPHMFDEARHAADIAHALRAAHASAYLRPTRNGARRSHSRPCVR